MRETFLQRLLHAADGLRELFPLSGEDVCLWLSIGLVGGIVNGGGCGHMGSFLSWARGALFTVGRTACRKKARTREIALPGRAWLLEGQAVVFFGLLLPLLFFEQRLK